jgi:DNA-binding response OmpR family regulator
MTSHILIAEDEADLRNVIAYALQRAGYRVTQAENGAAALELLEHIPSSPVEPYDVVITDLVMGHIDGIQVMRAALALPDSPAVMILTGHGSLNSAIDAVRLGAFDYLLKPCRIAHLLERLEQAIEWRQERLLRDSESRAWRRMRSAFYELDEQDTPTEDIQVSHVPSTSVSPVSESLPRMVYIGELQIDTLKHTIQFQEKPVHVTPTEYALLATLAASQGQPVDFDTLITQMREQDEQNSGSRSLLAWHIGNLRKKIARHYIISIRGIGYMLTEPYSSR